FNISLFNSSSFSFSTDRAYHLSLIKKGQDELYEPFSTSNRLRDFFGSIAKLILYENISRVHVITLFL
ncbi:hypothetical protein, partial [Streptococcus uberis]|uniref:hypothetical protein n=1 Tax=Streptococcus uberis TaxID=1349 RepID=UPI001E64D690